MYAPRFALTALPPLLLLVAAGLAKLPKGGRNLLLRLYLRKGMKKEAAAQAEWLKQNEHRVAMGRGR